MQITELIIYLFILPFYPRRLSPSYAMLRCDHLSYYSYNSVPTKPNHLLWFDRMYSSSPRKQLKTSHKWAKSFLTKENLCVGKLENFILLKELVDVVFATRKFDSLLANKKRKRKKKTLALADGAYNRISIWSIN